MQATTYLLPIAKEKPIGALIIVHAVLGIIGSLAPQIVPVYVFGFILYSLLRLVQNRNKDNYAAYAVVYVASIEMIFRLSKFAYFYEMGKYSIVLIMLVALIVEREKRSLPGLAILYFVLLLPSIIVAKYANFNEARTMISFNLSGPFSLCLSWLYFKDRIFTKKDFSNLCLNMILPIVSLVVFIIMRIPRHASRIFSNLGGYTMESSISFSGGYGPNQVAIILGYSFFILIFAYLLKVQVTFSKVMDIVFAFIFLGFSALTFSRGGTLTGLLAVVSTVYILIRSGRLSKQFSKIFFGVVLFTFFGYVVFQVLNKYTGNTLTQRYSRTFNSNSASESTGGIDLSGRQTIILRDLYVFLQHPILGSGPGGSLIASEDTMGIMNSHTEFSRLLSDHGLLGIFALILLLYGFFSSYRTRSPEEKAVLIGFGAICFLTMFHADMRLAIPGLAYGLSMIRLKWSDNPLEKA